jgi:protein-S-isoprenylcysteine O-methyltransferase Ste14
MSSEQSQVRTQMFARVLGPYFTIVPATVGVREADMRTLFTEFKANPMWPWLYGAILLMLGLVIIAFHQYWRSPAAAVGWLLAIRGVILLVVPQAYNSVGNAVEGGSGGQALVRVLAICLALAGLYLTYVGWIAKPRRPESAEGSPGEERVHAAGD